MVELVEYSLALLASSVMIGASVYYYTSFTGAASYLGERAAFLSISAAVASAERSGSASVTLQLNDVSLRCTGGVLSFTSHSFNSSLAVGQSCDFGYFALDGMKTIVASSAGGVLTLRVL